MEARHFKNKEGAVWMNMFETISSNYCLRKADRGSLSNKNTTKSNATPEETYVIRDGKLVLISNN